MLTVFTANSKTVLSLDFDRHKTCGQICSYCYVANIERIYLAYKRKIERNHVFASTQPTPFAAALNTEYWKLKNSKNKNWKHLNKLPVRIYGSGDYIPIHYEFLKDLNFKYFIISKALTGQFMKPHLEKLLLLPNLTKVVLSFDSINLQNYTFVQHLFNKDRIAFGYTGLADEFARVKTSYKFNIFFNTSKKKVERAKSRKFTEQCPCDSGLMKHDLSCTKCNKCWRSSIFRYKKYT